MAAVGAIIATVLWIFIIVMLVRFVVEWVQVFARDWTPSGVVLVALEGVYTVTDPPIRAVRSVIPPIRLGQVALDLSPMIVLLVCYLLLQINLLVFSGF